MKHAIINQILKDDNSFESAKLIADNFGEAKKKIIDDFWNDFKETTEKLFDSFRWNNYQIHFEIDDDACGLFFGFIAKNLNNEPIDNTGQELKPLVDVLKATDTEFINDKDYLGYIYSKNYTHILDLENKDLFQLSKNDYRENFIKKLVDEAKSYLDGFKFKVS